MSGERAHIYLSTELLEKEVPVPWKGLLALLSAAVTIVTQVRDTMAEGDSDGNPGVKHEGGGM